MRSRPRARHASALNSVRRGRNSRWHSSSPPASPRHQERAVSAPLPSLIPARLRRRSFLPRSIGRIRLISACTRLPGESASAFNHGFTSSVAPRSWHRDARSSGKSHQDDRIRRCARSPCRFSTSMPSTLASSIDSTLRVWVSGRVAAVRTGSRALPARTHPQQPCGQAPFLRARVVSSASRGLSLEQNLDLFNLSMRCSLAAEVNVAPASACPGPTRAAVAGH